MAIAVLRADNDLFLPVSCYAVKAEKHEYLPPTPDIHIHGFANQ